MAKMTRSQRRHAGRLGRASARAQGATARAAQGSPATASTKTQTGARHKDEAGSKRFIFESWGELKRSGWPTRSHVVQGTLVVLIACVIVGTRPSDRRPRLRNLVQDVFLR